MTLMYGIAANKPSPFSSKSTLRTGFICLITSIIVAGIALVLNDGFGANDMWAFLFWSVPFAAVVAFISVANPYRNLGSFARYCAAVIAGALIGVVWTFIVALLVGPWFLAFSFPVLSCWVAGGVSGMVIGS